jgi:hypothetical protein
MWGLLPLMMKSLFKGQVDNANAVTNSNFAAAALLPPPKHGKSVTIADFDILKPISRYVKAKCNQQRSLIHYIVGRLVEYI